jgi:hypothetical protein
VKFLAMASLRNAFKSNKAHRERHQVIFLNIRIIPKLCTRTKIIFLLRSLKNENIWDSWRRKKITKKGQSKRRIYLIYRKLDLLLSLLGKSMRRKMH